MKRTLFLLLIGIAFLIPLHSRAQTFRITDIEVTNTDYNKIATQTIGKTLVLQTFDNSITLDLDGQKHFVLKHNAGGYYSGVIDNTPYKKEYLEAFLHTSWTGTVTSLKFNYTFEQQQPPYKQFTVKMTAK